ncbi:MAG: class I SAM-dependent methyltransferase [Oleiphilaceae bacterium]|nr:class I SAM-dependent methyltransferase [Oleiphilaceae bacterium]
MSTGSVWYEQWVFSPLLSLADRALGSVRPELLTQARGRVLELGIGSGLSLPYYGPGVTELVGLEPSATLLGQCQQRLDRSRQSSAHSATVPTTLLQGQAETLPWPDNHFDTVVAFLVFCTIADPLRAVSELRRVLRPGGQLLFFEHVASPESGLERWQRRMNPLWRRLACGCHLTRDTHRLFREAGFAMDTIPVRRHPDIPLPLLAPTISGAVTHGG